MSRALKISCPNTNLHECMSQKCVCYFCQIIVTQLRKVFLYRKRKLKVLFGAESYYKNEKSKRDASLG